MNKQDRTAELDGTTLGRNTKATLHFSISLSDGSVVDSTYDKEPATFMFGDGSLLPNFEALLVGLGSGDQCRFELPPNKAFGDYNPANEQAIPRTQFANSLLLEPGLVIGFSDAGGGELPGVVKRVNEQFVMIDFNHPLAGKDIIFEASILSVASINAEMLITWIEKTDRLSSSFNE